MYIVRSVIYNLLGISFLIEWVAPGITIISRVGKAESGMLLQAGLELY